MSHIVTFLLLTALFQVSLSSTTREILMNECGAAVNEIYTFTIPSNSPNGPITLMQIQYDASRAVPVTSTTFQDSMSKIQNVAREDNFRPWNCSALEVPSIQPDCSNTFRMTPEQQTLSGYTSFDRGHLTPVNPNRFNFTAQDATFYCCNNAPQEPRTNQVYWYAVEKSILDRPEAGYVMTGTCNETNPDGVTNAGYTVPGCYFKFFCYKEGSSSEATVVGYIGENSLYDRTNTTADQIRKEETATARSQSEVLNRTGIHPEVIQQAWLGAEKSLLTNREADRAPTAQACIDALFLPADIRTQWSQRTYETVEQTLKGIAEQE